MQARCDAGPVLCCTFYAEGLRTLDEVRLQDRVASGRSRRRRARRWRKLEGSDPTTYEMILEARCRVGLGHMIGLGHKRRGARRWRKLEGSDPTTYEMILKVQALQRRLIGQTEAVAERELQLAEQGRGLAALRAALARQPGPEAIEQLGGMQARGPLPAVWQRGRAWHCQAGPPRVLYHVPVTGLRQRSAAVRP